jgi:hypothetical protein
MARPDICMTAEEADLLREASRKRRHVVEFGCGGSTLLLLENEVGVLDSVESDAAWADRVCREPGVSAAMRAGRFRMHAVDIGRTKAWGSPADETARDRWPEYPRRIWQDLSPSAVDFVFVDGRFRVACVLAALLHVGPPPLIAVHDFWWRLQDYGEILDFMDVVQRAGSLGIFALRGELDRSRVETRLAAYLTDPR